MQIIIDSDRAQFHAAQRVNGLPTDGSMVVTIKPYSKRRTSEQNRLQWAGMLGDIAKQAQIAGRFFSEQVWHEHCKERFLPDVHVDGITLKNYVKWIEMPSGNLKMVGSTTQLTTKGMTDYLDQCYALGCEMGVRFTTSRYE